MITVLSEDDLAAIDLPQSTQRTAVEAGLVAQAAGRAVAEPTSVFNPVPGRDDLIAVIRGALPDVGLALVKSVGGFPGNAAHGLATNPGCLTLIETQTGQTRALISAARITTERTAMVTAVGAARLARPGAGVVGCVGTAGIGVQAVRYLALMMQLTEVRLHGRHPARTKAAASALEREIKLPVVATRDWHSCFAGADILIDGAAMPKDRVLFPVEAFTSGAILIVFGAYSALPADIMDHSDRLIMDRWVGDGRGALGPAMATGRITETDVDAMIGDVIAGTMPGRTSDDERIVFCHRGTAACDLMLAQAYMDAAQAGGFGTQVPF